MILKNEQWNDLSGGIRIFPLEERPNVLNGNTYILNSDRATVVIDWGGCEQRAEKIEEILSTLPSDPERPVIAVVTHSHMDHIGGLARISPEFRKRLTVILHRTTAEILSDPDDAEMTNYRIFGSEPPKIKPDLLFFSGDVRTLNRITIQPEGNCEKVLIDGVEFFRVWEAPGHTPDGLFFAAAEVVFSGDAFYALNPGIVGLPGWNALSYRHSMQLLEGIFKQMQICCPGHDHAKTTGEFEPQLRELLFRAGNYKQVVRMTPERFAFLADFTKVFLSEIERFYTIISARLYLLARELEKSNQGDFAREFCEIVKFDEIEAITSRFRDSLNAGNDPNAQLFCAMRGIQTIRRIRKVLEGTKYGMLIDPSLLRRVDSLMNDFVNSISGLPFSCDSEPLELNALFPPFLRQLTHSGTPRELERELPPAMIQKFQDMNIFRKTELEFIPFENNVNSVLPKEHFLDGIQHILEKMAGSGAARITLKIMYKGIQISQPGFTAASGRRIVNGYVRRIFAVIGCHLGFGSDGIVILLPEPRSWSE